MENKCDNWVPPQEVLSLYDVRMNLIGSYQGADAGSSCCRMFNLISMLELFVFQAITMALMHFAPRGDKSLWTLRHKLEQSFL